MIRVIQIINGSGLTLENLKDFIEKCTNEGISNNTPVKICQHDNDTVSDAKDIQGDEESIIIYDWL